MLCAPTEKVLEFLDDVFKPGFIPDSSNFQILGFKPDSSNFIKKFKKLKEVPKDAIMVTAYVVCLFPSMPDDFGLEGLRRTRDDQLNKKTGTDNVVKLAEFVLKNNYLELPPYRAPPYASILVNQVENKFLQYQVCKTLVWFSYIDKVLFI